jgi:hypothetical protein
MALAVIERSIMKLSSSSRIFIILQLLIFLIASVRLKLRFLRLLLLLLI